MAKESLLRMCSGPLKLLHRLDRVAADLNVLLIMFAIGLAVLDLTFVFTMRLIPPPEVTYAAHTDGETGTSAAGGPQMR